MASRCGSQSRAPGKSARGAGRMCPARRIGRMTQKPDECWQARSLVSAHLARRRTHSAAHFPISFLLDLRGPIPSAAICWSPVVCPQKTWPGAAGTEMGCARLGRSNVRIEKGVGGLNPRPALAHGATSNVCSVFTELALFQPAPRARARGDLAHSKCSPPSWCFNPRPALRARGDLRQCHLAAPQGLSTPFPRN